MHGLIFNIVDSLFICICFCLSHINIVELAIALTCLTNTFGQSLRWPVLSVYKVSLYLF